MCLPSGLPRNFLTGRETCNSIFNMIFFAALVLHKIQQSSSLAQWELQQGEMKQQDSFYAEKKRVGFVLFFFFFLRVLQAPSSTSPGQGREELSARVSEQPDATSV